MVIQGLTPCTQVVVEYLGSEVLPHDLLHGRYNYRLLYPDGHICTTFEVARNHAAADAALAASFPHPFTPLWL